MAEALNKISAVDLKLRHFCKTNIFSLEAGHQFSFEQEEERVLMIGLSTFY